ncbi:MAG: integration host factor subunit alpha [Syntrophobacteraceae bacterium]|jgi:integration host factor subunit alpha
MELGQNQELEGNSVATLTKAQIVEALFSKNLFTKGESAQVIETLFELIKASLEKGDEVLISGFGKFCVREKMQRNGRNPQSGEPMTLPPRKVVTFKCSWVLRDNMNRETEKHPITKTKRR